MFSLVFVKKQIYISFFSVLFSFPIHSAEKMHFHGQSELFTLLRDDKTQMNSGLETELSVQMYN